ncbi:MAG: DLW-39 family protein [Desulfobulbaceae bacterium]|nr:DLW-39 family protein [Desulfobulbaceae bacterium]
MRVGGFIERGGLRLRLLGLVLVVGLAVAAVYGNSMQAPFVFDDEPNIVNNEALHIDSLGLPALLAAAGSGPSADRWLANLSFALNYYLGGGEVWGFHLVNVVVHAAAALVFFGLSLTTLTLPVFQNCYPRAREIALAATLLWALHPLQSNAVTYLVQRMASLSALFFMASLWCYALARLTTGSKARQNGLFALSACCGGLALASKENAAMLPVMILGYEWFFLEGLSWRRHRRRLLTVTAIAVAVVLGLAALYLGGDFYAAIQAGYARWDFTLPERLLTEPRVLFMYLGLILLPLPSRLNLCHDVVVSRGLFAPPTTAACLVGLAVLAALAVWLYRRERLLSFGIFWFLGNLLIESSFLPLYPMFEHRLYLPSTFLALAVVAGGYRLVAGGSARFRWALRLLLVALVVAGGLLTWQRNQVWADELTLWQDVVTKSPGLVGGYQNLGKILMTRGRDAEAEKVLRTGVVIGSGKASAQRVGSDTAISLGHLHYLLSRLYFRHGREGDASAAIDAALRYDPNHAKAMVSKAIRLEQAGLSPAAVQFYRAAALRGEESAELYCNWAVSLFSLGRLDEAITLLRRAIELEPGHADSHYNLGVAYGGKGMAAEARHEMALAIQLQQLGNRRTAGADGR